MSYDELKDAAVEEFRLMFDVELNMRDIFEQGFNAGFVAGLDRGMEIERDVQVELQREGMPFSYDD